MHRPEMVPLITENMQTHDALFLEEPPTEEFGQMLAGSVTVDEYSLTSDAEYPKYTESMCSALRELHAQGKKIIQIEPYLENLLELHDFLADGGGPDDLNKDTVTFLVYLTEKNVTGALLSYYQASVSASFESTIEAVKRFAQADAARFRLRDSLRAQELSVSIPNYASSFIEAGMMHLFLRRLLKRQLPMDCQVQAVYTADKVLRHMGKSTHLYSPGDQLTFLYIFNPNFSDRNRQSLLAARALIYSKIIRKEELRADTLPFPHILDELLCIDATRRLSIEDCRQLFERIRGASTFDSRQIVSDHVKNSRPYISQKLKQWIPSQSDGEGIVEHDAHSF